jgi:capsule biosynthesis phosphatase
MLIIIPLGGLGDRFKKFSYNNPKPLINVFGKPIIFWLLDSLNLNNIEQILIPYNKELKKYNFEDELINKYPKYKFKFLELDGNTRGATETVLKILETLSIEINDCPILSLDGDNFYNCDIITQWNGENKIFSFKDFNIDPIYSYIKFENEEIIDIVEKIKISDFACCGSYGFNSWKSLKNYCNYVIDNNILQKGEFYISNVIKQMISNKIIFKNSIIPKEHFICLGTPLHVKIFCNNCPKINNITKTPMIEHKRICFDLDNTLVTYPIINSDYTSVKPIEHNIEFLKLLKQAGHTIIIYTARRMKTHNSNTGKLLKDIGKITFDTLEKYNIPYDEIYFGKPYADFYIDDKAINAFSELDKEIGFYNSKIDTRDFNNLTTTNIIEVLKKNSNNLDGQIYYYLNIPSKIKDLFPFFFSYDTINFKWYDMEKINGIPISKLYIKNELNLDLFSSILSNLDKIHECTIVESFELNIYENYCKKLKNRYESYNFKNFDDIDNIYNNIYLKLEEYENKNLGKIVMIHGDPVFTNIIINNFGKIIFIDMRGKIDKVSTIRGDILYDYAKIYQSLVGYDEILNDVYVNPDLKDTLISHFKKKFMEKFNEDYWIYLSYITASLLLTLIPLHNNDKCHKYYNLIKKII